MSRARRRTAQTEARALQTTTADVLLWLEDGGLSDLPSTRLRGRCFQLMPRAHATVCRDGMNGRGDVMTDAMGRIGTGAKSLRLQRMREGEHGVSKGQKKRKGSQMRHGVGCRRRRERPPEQAQTINGQGVRQVSNGVQEGYTFPIGAWNARMVGSRYDTVNIRLSGDLERLGARCGGGGECGVSGVLHAAGCADSFKELLLLPWRDESPGWLQHGDEGGDAERRQGRGCAGSG